MARLSPGRKDGALPDPAELARNSGEKAALPILTFSASAGPGIEARRRASSLISGDRPTTVRRKTGEPLMDRRSFLATAAAAGTAAAAAGTAATRAAHAAGGKTFVLVHGGAG